MAYNYYQMTDFYGGENSSTTPDNILDNQMVICENVELLPNGGFKKRAGYKIHEKSSLLSDEPTARLFEFTIDIDGVSTLCRGALCQGILLDINNGYIMLPYLEGATYIDYEVFNNKLYFLTNNNFYVYDGKLHEGLSHAQVVTTTETDNNLDKIKKCRYIEQRGQRLFATGNPDEPNMVYFCEVGRPDWWKVTNIIKAVTDDNDVITGLKEFHGSLLVFKTRTIFAWSGSDPYNDVVFKQLSVHTGTKAYRTICNVGNYLCFLGEDGVYALVGTYENVISTIKLSENIKPRIDKIQHKTPYNVNTPHAVYYDGKYMLSVSTTLDNVNNTVYVLYADTIETTKSWVIYTDWKSNDMLHSLDGSFYMASAESGAHILKLYNNIAYDEYMTSGGNYAKRAINANIVTKPLTVNSPIHNKKYRRGYIVTRKQRVRTSSLMLGFYTGEDDPAFIHNYPLPYDTSNPTKPWSVDYTYFNIKTKSTKVLIILYNNKIDEFLEVDAIVIEYKVKKPRR